MLDKSNNKSINLFNIVQKDVKEITHKDKEGNDIPVNLNHLGSSMKDAVITGIKNNIKALSKLKRKDFKVGGLMYIY